MGSRRESSKNWPQWHRSLNKRAALRHRFSPIAELKKLFRRDAAAIGKSTSLTLIAVIPATTGIDVILSPRASSAMHRT
jgi:hypothetical protein